ncbi:MAG TPA: hypothetical protein VLM75_07525 [Spirochaetota bacterium]|nr:hypothetical protein [Spirochaetota bacterium]
MSVIVFRGGWTPEQDFVLENGLERSVEISEAIDSVMESLEVTADDEKARITGGIYYIEIDGEEFEVPFELGE